MFKQKILSLLYEQLTRPEGAPRERTPAEKPEAQDDTNDNIQLPVPIRHELHAVILLFDAACLFFQLERLESTKDIVAALDAAEAKATPSAMLTLTYCCPVSSARLSLAFSSIGGFITIHGALKDDEEHEPTSMSIQVKEILAVPLVFPISTIPAVMLQVEERARSSNSLWIYRQVDKWIKVFYDQILTICIPDLAKLQFPFDEDYEEQVRHERHSEPVPNSLEEFTRRAETVPGARPFQPFEIGRSDLDILSPPSASSGMIMGPHHPSFHCPPGHPMSMPSQSTPPTFPPGSIPPGARFDPVTPLGPLPFNPSSSYGSMGRPMHGYPSHVNPFDPAPYSGEPDFDELLPPGSNLSPSGPGRPFSQGPFPFPRGPGSSSSGSSRFL